MKRSEMIKQLQSFVVERTQYIHDMVELDCEGLLADMEKAGMLPPTIQCKYKYMVSMENKWQPEDEESSLEGGSEPL